MQATVSNKASLLQKSIWLAISYLLFAVIYYNTGKYAQGLNDVPSVAFDFERLIPFTSWMIIPYMSSGCLFLLSFYFCETREQLMLISKRIILLTIVSGVLFMLFPLKNSFIKPEVTTLGLSFFFQQLKEWDTPFNQAPSLHIAYACTYWTAASFIKQKTISTLLKGWLVLLCISTLTVYQHHLIDILSALILVALIFKLIPNKINLNK